MTAIGGAYSGYAEGLDGSAINAAAPGVREPFSFKHVDYDFGADFSLPGSYSGTDFDNRGENRDPRLASTVNGFLYAHAAAQVQVGEFGASITGEFFQYDVNPSNGGLGITLLYGRYHGLVAYGLAHNQVVVGAGARIVTLRLQEQQSNTLQSFAQGGGRTLVTLNGLAPEVGVVVKPDNFPLRLGATVRAPVEASQGGVSANASQVQMAGAFIAPQKAVLPWELDAGFALQLGPRPLNPPWLEPSAMEAPVREAITRARARREREHRAELARTEPAKREILRLDIALAEEAVRAIEEQRLAAEVERLYQIRRAREANWPRERILFLGGLLITGQSNEAVALEGFVTRQRELVGTQVSLTPRFGLESEPIPNWLHARVGSYLEPSRFGDGNARQHFTFGADIKLIPFSPWGIFGDMTWRLSFATDLAPRYQNFGFGLGAWH